MNLVSDYRCHHWTKDDYRVITRGGWSIENERRRCVDYYNFVFSPDEDNHIKKYTRLQLPGGNGLQGCGECWCCEPLK